MRFFQREREKITLDRRKKACLGGRGAGERGAYADDGESGVQRAHSLTLLWPPGKDKGWLAPRPSQPYSSLMSL